MKNKLTALDVQKAMLCSTCTSLKVDELVSLLGEEDNLEDLFFCLGLLVEVGFLEKPVWLVDGHYVQPGYCPDGTTTLGITYGLSTVALHMRDNLYC